MHLDTLKTIPVFNSVMQYRYAVMSFQPHEADLA